MKKKLLLFGALLLSAGFARAQTTIVSGTVIDPNGWPYSGGVGPVSGRISGKILPPGVTSIRVGGKVFSTTFNAGLDINGHFSITLADNNLATPVNTQWQFTVCGYGALPPLGTGGQCFTAPPITITGSAQDISTQLNAVAKVLLNVKTGFLAGCPGLTVNKEVLFNDNGNCGGDPLLNYDKLAQIFSAPEVNVTGAGAGVAEFYDPGHINFVGFGAPPAVSISYTMLAPPGIGAPNQVLQIDTVVGPVTQLKFGAGGSGCVPGGLLGVLQASDGAGGCQDTAITETVVGPGATFWNAVSSAAGFWIISDVPFSGAPLFAAGCSFSVAIGVADCSVTDTTTGRQLGLFTIASSGFTDTAATPSTCARWDASVVIRSAGADCPTVPITASDKNRTCMIIIGADNGAALADADIGPQVKQCQIPAASTVYEIDVAADNGTPSVQIEARACVAAPCNAGNESSVNLLSAPLTVAAGGGTSCSQTGAGTGLDAQTTCSATLQNTAINPGMWFGTVSGTAGGVAARVSIAIHFTVN